MLGRVRLLVLVLFVTCSLLKTVQTLPAAQPKCTVRGYVYKLGLRPLGASVEYLRRVQSPSRATLAEVTAACDADPTCLMFTTDGWLIAITALRTADVNDKPDLEAISHDNFDISWQEPDCGPCNSNADCCGSSSQQNKCCGTYVTSDVGPNTTYATSLLAKLIVITETEQAKWVGHLFDHSRPVIGRRPCESATRVCSGAVLGVSVDAKEPPHKGAEYLQLGQQPQHAARCTQSLQAVQHLYPSCCRKCLAACCPAISEHVKEYAAFQVGVPTSGDCISSQLKSWVERTHRWKPQVISYKQQLQFIQMNMPLFTASASACTTDCSSACGFTTSTVSSPGVLHPCSLSCVLSKYIISWRCFGPLAFAAPGMYPSWMMKQYVVKSRRRVSGAFKPHPARDCKLC